MTSPISQQHFYPKVGLHNSAQNLGQLGLIFKKDAPAQLILFWNSNFAIDVDYVISNFKTVESEKFVESIDWKITSQKILIITKFPLFAWHFMPEICQNKTQLISD